MRHTQALLFDYGGTLDTAACHWSYVLEEGYRHAGIHLSEADFRTAYVFAERALAKSPIVKPDYTFRRLLEEKVQLELQSLSAQGVWSFASDEEHNNAVDSIATVCDTFAHEHVKQSRHTLEKLHDKYKLIMVSNFYGNLPTILQTYGIAHLFDAVVESAVVGVRKPNPEIWSLGVKAAQCEPSETIAIGDSFSKDIIPAQSIGCQTIWFKGKEWEEKEYDETLPTHIISSLEELTELL